MKIGDVGFIETIRGVDTLFRVKSISEDKIELYIINGDYIQTLNIVNDIPNGLDYNGCIQWRRDQIQKEKDEREEVRKKHNDSIRNNGGLIPF